MGPVGLMGRTAEIQPVTAPAAASAAAQTPAPTAVYGPDNPFYALSTLPFQAPPFDKIKDSDYQPAIDAGMAMQINEVEAIANDSAPPNFENTIIALERTGREYRDHPSHPFHSVHHTSLAHARCCRKARYTS